MYLVSCPGLTDAGERTGILRVRSTVSLMIPTLLLTPITSSRGCMSSAVCHMTKHAGPSPDGCLELSSQVNPCVRLICNVSHTMRTCMSVARPSSYISFLPESFPQHESCTHDLIVSFTPLSPHLLVLLTDTFHLPPPFL